VFFSIIQEKKGAEKEKERVKAKEQKKKRDIWGK
jgi:hypothetical protein